MAQTHTNRGLSVVQLQTKFVRERFSGRKGRLMRKFKEMNPLPGHEIRIGIPQHAKSDIYAVAGRLGLLITVMKTEDTVTRDDGETVPVYIVSFR
jgi:hypothetical protein